MTYRSIWTYLAKTPFELKWVDVDGVNTRYVEAGPKDAPAVIMLHGIAGSLENFAANIAAHAEHFHVFALDLMGCGWSDRPDFPYTGDIYANHLLSFMNVLNIEKASFIGLSLGSKLAAYFAHLHPERTQSFIMIAAVGITADEEAQRKWAEQGLEGRRAATANPTWETITDVFRYLILDDEDVVDDLVATRLAIYSDPSFKAALPNIIVGAESEWMEPADWKKLEMPILVIGSPDGAVPFYKNALLIESICPNARRVDIPNTDHWAQFEKPDIFNPLSISFLRETA